MLQLVFENSGRPGDTSDACTRCLGEDPLWNPIKRSFSKQCVAIQCTSMIWGSKEAAKLQVGFVFFCYSYSVLISKGESRWN